MKSQLFLCCALMAMNNFLSAMQLMRTPYQIWLDERRMFLKDLLNTQVNIEYSICDNEKKAAYIAVAVSNKLMIAKFLNYTEFDITFGNGIYEPKGFVVLRPRCVGSIVVLDMILKKWRLPAYDWEDQLMLHCHWQAPATETTPAQMQKRTVTFSTDGREHVIHYNHYELLNENTCRFFRQTELPLIAKDDI